MVMTQMGFFDLSDRHGSLDAKKDPLLEIDALVPWEEFRPALERIWRKPNAGRESHAGRKPIDAILMFKALVLSALYTFSDDQIAYQVRDRLSFMYYPAGHCVAMSREGDFWGLISGIVCPMPRRCGSIATHWRKRARWRSCSIIARKAIAKQSAERGASQSAGLHRPRRTDLGRCHRASAAQPQHAR
jgi:hypothetical protein